MGHFSDSNDGQLNGGLVFLGPENDRNAQLPFGKTASGTL